MAKKEIKTDLWVARQLDDCKIEYDAQGSDVKEIHEALQTASKKGTGNAGYGCTGRGKKGKVYRPPVMTSKEEEGK